MLLIVVIGIAGVGLLWLGSYTSKHYAPAAGTGLFWMARIEKLLGWVLLAMVVVGLLAYVFLSRTSG